MSKEKVKVTHQNYQNYQSNNYSYDHQSDRSDRPDRSVDNIKTYISDKTPLTYEEQLWIFRKDPSRRTDADSLKLIDSNLAMVFQIVSKLYQRHKQMSNGFKASCEVLFADMFQAGVMGLNRAVVKFDSKLEMKFSTYAYYWIEAFIKMEIKRTISPIKTQAYAKVTFDYTDIDPHNEMIDPSCIYDQIDYGDIISIAEKSLSELDYRIFTLRFIKEFDVKSIARSVNKCDVTIRTHIKSIRAVLLKKLR